MAAPSNSGVQEIPDYFPARGSLQPRLRMRDGSLREIEVLNSLSHNGQARHTVITSPKDLHKPAFRADVIAQVQRVHNVMMQAFSVYIDPADVEFKLDEQGRCVIEFTNYSTEDGTTFRLAEDTYIAGTVCRTVADVMCVARDVLLFPKEFSGSTIEPETAEASREPSSRASKTQPLTFVAVPPHIVNKPLFDSDD